MEPFPASAIQARDDHLGPVGYAAIRPIRLPNGARICVQFVIN
jgi:hypothetical protein